MKSEDSIVGIYSPQNILTNKLKQKFEQMYLEVKTFDDFNSVDFYKFNYLIINLIDLKIKPTILLEKVRDLKCKILILHHLYVKEDKKFIKDSELQNLISINPNIGVLLIPEILGKDIDFNANYISHNLIMQSLLSERVKISTDNQLINTISLTKLAERIIKDTFSFGISGQIISLIGPRKSTKTYVTKYLNISNENIIYIKEQQKFTDLYSTSISGVEFSLRLATKNTKDTLKKKTDEKIDDNIENKSIQTNKPNKTKNFNFKFINIYKLALVIIFVLLIPVYLIGISFLLLYYSVKINLTNANLATTLLNKSLLISDIGRKLSFGNNFIYDSSNIIHSISSLTLEGTSLAKNSQDFISKIMSPNIYDLNQHTSTISSSLDKIYTDTGFLQSDINNLNGLLGNFIRYKLMDKQIDISEYKNKVYNFKNLVSRASVLLGDDKPKKYLVIFQNNMELRPTGGFIGSFGLLTFDKGRLSEMVVNDVYSADGQLKGHVDPPEPIYKYLGEGGWYLRDANWDPSFPVSAQKIEWFLEKEIGEHVDGVIALDLNFIKRMLLVSGPVNLPEFGLLIDKDNLYPTIQSEVEENFFPGSIKKASILTSLSKNLIIALQNIDSNKHLPFLKELHESLERREVQIYLHDRNGNEALSKLNYSGHIDLTSNCGPKCLQDGYALIDANLGVNKSNYFITRSHQLNLSFSKENIDHELLTTYTNSSSQAIGQTGVYKNYARVLLPSDAKISGIRLYHESGEFSDLEYDLVDMEGRREVGFLVTVLPETKKILQVNWTIVNSNLNQGGQYKLKIIKQAGTENDRLEINIKESNLVLTGKWSSSYNTNLAKDFKAKMFFKQK